ncbi:MAG: YceH family protein [Burkholderiaceae bacterium]
MGLRTLSPLEARVLGVLIEKAHTVPDSYPLSLNSLTLGCNQKTARDPVINASEAEVQMAVDSLKGLSLAFESSGSRVTRYEHNLGRALGLPSQSVALLAALLLRGPQTMSELRINCERLHRFADLSAVEGFLDELAARPEEKGGPLVVKLARQAGAREQRWMHQLCGAVDPGVASAGADAQDFVATSEIVALKQQQAALKREVDELRLRLDQLYVELGVARTT